MFVCVCGLLLSSLASEFPRRILPPPCLMPRESVAFEGFCMYSMTESMIAASTWFILDHKEWRSFLQVEANRENTCKEKSVFLEQENTSGSEVIPGPPTPCLFIFSCIKMCSRFVSRACCELRPRCTFCRRTWKDLYIRNSPAGKYRMTSA